MAADVETSGIIVKTSECSCVVSVNIDGCTRSFSVSKTIFYVFGVKCEGDLTNLVEEDTEVELSYRVRPGNAPTVVAVWLGEKPDLSEDGERRIPIYDRKGVLNEFIVDSDFGQVYVNRGVIFRDGQRETGIILNEEVVFDAVPVQEAHFSGAFYEATCVWIGFKPKLVDRFHLEVDARVDEAEDVELEDDVCGTVVVIPNDVVAFVDVKLDSVVVKVMLFRNSFRRVCHRIQDSVDVGDKLCIRLRYAFVFPGRKHWFAVSARKASDEVLVDEIYDSEAVESDAAESDDVKGDYLADDKDVLKTDGGVKSSIGVKTGSDRKSEEVDKFVKVVDLLTSLTTGEAADESVKGMRSVDTKEAVSEGSNAKAVDQFDKGSPTLYSDPPLEGVLRPNGCITSGSLKVFLDPSNFYIGSCPVDDFAFISNGSITVSFEAVLMRRKEEIFSEFSHEATCAWVEKKPALAAIALSLPPPNFQLLNEPKRTFYGKVIKICFPRVALMMLPDESTVGIDVNSFVTKPQYPLEGLNLISSFVRLDDWVQFKVKMHPTVVLFLTAHEAGPVFTPELWAKISPGIALLRDPSKPDALRSDSLASKPSTSKVKAPDASPRPAVCITSPFKTGRVALDRTYLINCAGTIKNRHDELLDKNFITVQHVFGSTKITDKTVYFSDGKSLSLDSIATRSGRLVHFDAQTSMSLNSNAGFVVTRMWDGVVRPASEVVLFSELKLFETVPTRCCPAKIITIPLHDTAIASVKGVPILVPFDSLVTLEEVNLACSAIDTHLSVGDFVGLKFEKRKFPGEMSGFYFRAVRCWSLSKGGEKITLDDEIRIAESRTNSWFSLWGCGQFFCEGHLREILGRYYVDYTPKSVGGLMLLDIFEKGQVSDKGQLVEFKKFEAPKDGKISFHVGHSYVANVSNNLSRKMVEPDRFFVACSWIGRKPDPERLLRDILAVSNGWVCSNRIYEVAVQSFPTPTHAICRLGYLPVLVPLPQLTQDGKFVGVQDVHLSKGDKILVNVLVRDVEHKTVLVSNTSKYKRVKDFVYQDVLKNVSGKIVTLPNPTGLIKAFNSDLEVSFELCSVRRNTREQNVDSAWLDSLSKKFTPGKKVYFSAVKVDAKTAPYKAFEVCCSESYL